MLSRRGLPLPWCSAGPLTLAWADLSLRHNCAHLECFFTKGVERSVVGKCTVLGFPLPYNGLLLHFPSSSVKLWRGWNDSPLTLARSCSCASIATGGMYWIATIGGIHRISSFSLTKCWKSDLSGCQLSVSYVVWIDFFSFPDPEASNVWHRTKTIPDKDILWDGADEYSPVSSPSYVEISPLSLCTCPSYIYSISALFSCHMTTWGHWYLFLKLPQNLYKGTFLILTSTFRQARNVELVKTSHQHPCSEWTTCHYRMPTVPTAAQPPTELFPSTDADHHFQNLQNRACWFLQSHASCYYSMLQDDRVTPEGDQVMSRRDTEVGQLLGVCYIIHIHKQHPVVAEWTQSTQTVYSAHWALSSV